MAHPTLSFDEPVEWQDLIDHPALEDVPFKIELDERGCIVLASPFSVQRGRMKARLARALDAACGDVVTFDAAVPMGRGVCVADVAWTEPSFFSEHEDGILFPTAPPICAEIKSPSNTEAEMEEKVTLYLAKGATEVWICDLEGRVTFFGHEGERGRSTLAPDFPSQI
ncbi:MAG: Uma2 family endonuclease [Bacteroidota bacterium]